MTDVEPITDDDYEDPSTGFRVYAHDPEIDGPQVDLSMPQPGVTDPTHPNGPCPKAPDGMRHQFSMKSSGRVYCAYCKKTLRDGAVR